MLKNPFFIVGIVFSFILFIYYVFQDYFRNRYEKDIEGIDNQVTLPTIKDNNYHYNINFTKNDYIIKLYSNYINDSFFLKYVYDNIQNIVNDIIPCVVVDSNNVVTSLRGEKGNNTKLECILFRVYLCLIDHNNLSFASMNQSINPDTSKTIVTLIQDYHTKFEANLNNLKNYKNNIGGKTYTLDSICKMLFTYYFMKIQNPVIPILKDLVILPKTPNDFYKFNIPVMNKYLKNIDFSKYMKSINQI